MEDLEELFYRYNPWWEGDYTLRDIYDRKNITKLLVEKLSSKEIIFLTGLRRVGKTTIFKLVIKKLLEDKNISRNKIFYISLDDYLLLKNNIIEIIEEYRKIHKISFSDKIFVFLDEITYKNDYEIQLKNLYDMSNVKIFASSSSSSVLRSRKPYLVGRYILIELLPLDFEEFLDFRKIKISKMDLNLVQEYFKDYMKTGGIPEYVLNGDIEYLKELVDDVINKDIANLYKVKNVGILKDFFILLMERVGKQVSLNKIAKILDISPDSSKRYFDMFIESYLIYTVTRCGKTNEKILSPKKVYASDLGIKSLFTGFKDLGSLFENYVYLKIKNFNPCYIYKDGFEIDFLTYDKTLIEVKYNSEMNEKQRHVFNSITSKKKVEIKNIYDLEEFLKSIPYIKIT
ncbi:MAG: ATP-binding protein [Actinobacteria bacterium]|nr:ATP-binding protein [Cyanobacteriota bacterium]MCL5771652.1 ATP-binding protein [Actinomycetota bacterium]